MSPEEAGKPRIFLCPGVYGDDRRLAHFRRFCAPLLNLVLVDLPRPEAPTGVLRDVAQTGVAVGGKVDALQPAGLVRFAGYSFGGNVAFEAAQHLARQGRPVSLALIDAYLAEPRAAAAMAGRPIGRRLVWAAFDAFCLWDRMRRSLLKLVGRYRPTAYAGLARRMLWSLRGRATRDWEPQPLDAPMLLVMSEPFAPGLARWHTVAPHATVLRLPFDHWDILKPPSATLLRDALIAHVELASHRQPRG